MSTSVQQTTEDVVPTPAAATRPVASSVAVTQDTTEMELRAQVSSRMIECVLDNMPTNNNYRA